FYTRLLRVEGWQQLPLAQAAQAVQRSADGSLYADDEKPARRLVAALTGLDSARLAGCAAASVGPQGWTQPARGPITSPYGPRGEDDFHSGTDIGVPKGTKVHAAAAGKVTTAECNAHRDGAPYSCDIDGSPWVKGCGWYIDLTHPGGVLTRYCHLLSRPYVSVGQQVAAGQVIGVSGNSGNTSGPHLHYEVRVNGSAIDAEPWHRTHGAPLGPA
ncbi:MAG: M23 family metallopeptidase, partial [Natronosporangium sp.]